MIFYLHTARVTANQARGIAWIFIIWAKDALFYHALPIGVADERHKAVETFPVTCMAYRLEILYRAFRLRSVPSYAVLNKRYEDPDTLVPLRVSHLDYAVIPKPAKDHLDVPIDKASAAFLPMFIIFHCQHCLFRPVQIGLLRPFR